MNWGNLKSAVNSAITTNDNQEITGAVLNSTLKAIIDAVGANATYAGIATPSTNPGTPDGPVFYFALQGGTYTNFSATVIQEGLTVLLWDGTYWSSESVFNKETMHEVYDISAANSGTTYPDLSAALGTNGANVPSDVRKGGMSVKFIYSSDNKYVQYRYMDTETTGNPNPFLDTANWQGVDEELYHESKNLAMSKGAENADYKLAKDNNLIYFRKSTTGIYNNGHVVYDNLDIKQGDIYKFALKAKTDFNRIIVCYNGNDNGGNRIFDISNGIAGQEYTRVLIAPVDIVEIRDMAVNSSAIEIEISFVKSKVTEFDFNVLHNILDSENVSLLVDKYINESGEIADASAGNGYRVIKLYIPAGKYIVGNGTGRASLWRYSDNTYATPVECVIPIGSDFSQNIVKEVTLTAGYYAISCNSGNSYSNALNSIYIIQSDSNVNGITKALIDAPIVNTRLIHNFINTLFIKSRYAIVNGAIVSGWSVDLYYKAIYTHLPAGRYIIYTPNGTSSSDAFWKFTDASCSALSKQILGRMDVGEMTFIDVEDGYYIFCFLKPTDASETAFLISAVDEEARQIWDNYFSNYTQYAHVENDKYINSSGQISAASAGNGYSVTRLRLLNDGKFYISVINTGSSCLLAKYTDDTYSTVESIIVGSVSNYKNIVNLESGYYALGYNAKNGKIPDLFKLKDEEDVIKRIVKYDEPFNGQYLSDLLLEGTASRASDGKITVSGGISNRAYGDFLMAWYYSLSAKFKCSNGVSMIIGKAFGWFNAGNYFEVYKDNNGSYIRRCKLSHPNATMTVEETKTLDFSLNENEEYTIILTKQPLKTTVEIIGSYNEYYTADFNMHNLYGQAFIASNNTAVVSEFYFGISSYYDTRNLKLVLWGHSYAEATGSTGEQYMNSFPGLLAQAIGEKVFVDMGFGGDIFGQLLRRMIYEVQYVRKAQYAMICIGENDATVTTQNAINSFVTMCTICEQNNIIPIIFTMEPDSTGYRNPNSAEINEWIRSSGYLYVDMDKVFWDENGNIRTNLYGDGVHPTIAGHRLIFNRIKMDCPFLF